MKTKHGLLFGLAVMFIAAIFSLALLGCPTEGSDDSGGGTVFISTTSTRNAEETKDFTKATTAYVGEMLYACGKFNNVNINRIEQGYVWKKDGTAIEGETMPYYLPTAAGKYSFTFTLGGKSATSNEVTVSFLTADTVSISVEGHKTSDDPAGSDISVTLELSAGTWKYEEIAGGLTGFSDEAKGKFKNAITFTDGVTDFDEFFQVIIDGDSSGKKVSIYLSAGIKTGSVNVSLKTDALSALVPYTYLASSGTLTAGTTTSASASW
jgi:hypothetical protein